MIKDTEVNKRRGLGTSVHRCVLDEDVDVDGEKADTEITYKPKGKVVGLITDVSYCLLDEKPDYEQELRGYWKHNKDRKVLNDIYETEYTIHGVNCRQFKCKCTLIEQVGDHCR
jgi:hypothetical protein